MDDLHYFHPTTPLQIDWSGAFDWNNTKVYFLVILYQKEEQVTLMDVLPFFSLLSFVSAPTLRLCDSHPL